MRKILLALPLLMAAGQAQATGTLTCSIDDANLQLDFSADTPRALMKSFFGARVRATVQWAKVPADLRDPNFAEGIVQSWWRDNELRLHFADDRLDRKPASALELVIEAKRATGSDVYNGAYRLTLYGEDGVSLSQHSLDGEATCEQG